MSEEYLTEDSQLFSFCPVPVFIYDEYSKRILFVNDAAIRYYGYSREEFLELNAADIRPKEEIPIFLNNVGNATPGSIKRGIWIHQKKGGERVRVEILVFRITYKTSPALLVIVTECDVSQEAAESQIDHDRQRVARVPFPSFLSHLIHEIRTPLNSILSSVALIETTALSTEQEQYVRFMSTASSALLALANDFLDFAKLRAGVFDVVYSSCQPVQLVERAYAVIAPDLTLKGLNYSMENAADAPVSFEGDPHRVQQILLNFFSNAVKFTLKGGIVARIKQGDEGENRVRFEVSDTGIGISPEYIPRVFDLFSQEDPTTAARFGGTGLGLSLSKKLAELMGGTIGVESMLGGGSTFWLELPCAGVRAN